MSISKNGVSDNTTAKEINVKSVISQLRMKAKKIKELLEFLPQDMAHADKLKIILFLIFPQNI